MEIRVVNEIKIYKLVMNPVYGRAEDCVLVAASTDYQLLINYYNSLKVPMYTDGRFRKSFRQGSRLENFNPCDTYLDPNGGRSCFGQGICVEWCKVDDIKAAMAVLWNMEWLGFESIAHMA